MKLTLEDGIYEGDVQNNQPHGFGKLTYNDDTTLYYEGFFRNGERHGTGKILFKDGNFAEGIWEDDGLVYGKIQDSDGYYEGFIAMGERHGFGEEHLNNGRSWKGIWRDGKKVVHSKSDPIPNAVLVLPSGEPKLIRIDNFLSEESLGAPLGCTSIDFLSTAEMEELSKILETPVAAYTDSNANQKYGQNNYVMCDLSGYDYLPGPYVICGGTKSQPAPLDYQNAELIFDTLLESFQEQ